MVSVSGEKLFVVQATPVVNAVKPLAAQFHVVMINHAAVDPSIANGQNYMFTTIATAAQEAPPLARYMTQVAKVSKMATLTDSSAIGKAATATMSAAFKVYGGKVVDTEKFPTGSTDFKAQLIKIQQSGADAVFMAPNGAQGAANILKQARDLGLNVKFYADTFFEDPALPGLAGSLANGVVYSHVAFNPTRNAFAKSLQAAWAKSGETGVVPIYTATSYDAVLLLADALKHVGSYDATKVRDYLLKEKNFVGATGGITFTKQGQARMAVELKTVSGGKFVKIKTPPIIRKKK
jgi:branched-chain amino acid transport system substrate-binding protein